MPPFLSRGLFVCRMIPMPMLIELLTPAEIASLEHVFGMLVVVAPPPVQSLGETPEPEEPAAKHEYFRQMMESNTGPVLAK